MTSGTLSQEPAQAAVGQGNTLPTQYTVQKDDTLQKISKKFYGSYSKWTGIYDANKDKIRDPNFLKPGVILTIPALEAPATE
jgi:nucleoid-associated protein YgaU